MGAPGGAGVVGVPPDEPAGVAGKLIQNIQTTQVSTMDEGLCAGLFKKQDSLPDQCCAAVTVRENSELHVICTPGRLSLSIPRNWTGRRLMG